MSRVEFNRAARRAIIERASGKCEKCSATLKPGEGEVDHILPCSLGGKAEIANGWLLCRVCHVEKSGNDIRRTRKADRQRDRFSGAIVAKQRIRSAGFPRKARREKLPIPGPSLNPLWRGRAGELIKPIGSGGDRD